MKKNLISILILALLVVNVVLTAIMMFSVTSSAKKTSALVTNIASVLNIELTNNTKEEGEPAVDIVDSIAFDIPKTLNIPLKKSEGEDKIHYCVVDVSFYMNSKHEDYATRSAAVSSNAGIIQNIIIDVIGSKTLDEAQADPEALKQEILKRVQTEFNSTFIYKVAFRNIMWQ